MKKAVQRFFGEPEICNFSHSFIVHEDVSKLEIAVEILVLSNFEETVNDILDDRKSLCFGNTLSLFEVGTEVALGAALSDDVAV
jgi:hypothetical protein